jgi:hypothetical protein
MNKKIVLFGVATIFILLDSSVNSQPRIDYSLLVGEWGDTGKCNQNRTIFTQKGRYVWMEKKSGRWKTLYSGIYFPYPKSKISLLQRESPKALGAIYIAERPNAGGDTVEIHTLTSNKYSGKWNASWSDGLSFENPRDAFFDFVKCPFR